MSVAHRLAIEYHDKVQQSTKTVAGVDAVAHDPIAKASPCEHGTAIGNLYFTIAKLRRQSSPWYSGPNSIGAQKGFNHSVVRYTLLAFPTMFALSVSCGFLIALSGSVGLGGFVSIAVAACAILMATVHSDKCHSFFKRKRNCSGGQSVHEEV